MATNYTGDPTATEAPSPPPAPGEFPVLVLPADGDALSAASVAQAYKVLADFSAFAMDILPRAWGFVTYGSSSPTIASGYGIASVSEPSGAGLVEVTLDDTPPDASFAVIATCNGAAFAYVSSMQTIAPQFEMLIRTDAGAGTRQSFMLAVFWQNP